jgi:hypothetical protein
MRTGRDWPVMSRNRKLEIFHMDGKRDCAGKMFGILFSDLACQTGRTRIYTILLNPAALPHVARPILVVLLVEYLVWLFLTHFLSNVPRCPLCKSSFRWGEIDTYDERGRRRSRPLSFPCPQCLQIIGVPSWRASFLRSFYLALIGTLLFVIFDSSGDLLLGYLGALAAAVGAVQIADWFIWNKLEPGSPSSLT